MCLIDILKSGLSNLYPYMNPLDVIKKLTAPAPEYFMSSHEYAAECKIKIFKNAKNFNPSIAVNLSFFWKDISIESPMFICRGWLFFNSFNSYQQNLQCLPYHHIWKLSTIMPPFHHYWHGNRKLWDIRLHQYQRNTPYQCV